MRSVWLLAASVLCTVSHHSVAGESGDSQDENNNYNYNNNDDGNFVTQATSRIEQDLVDMWDSSPSSWGDEYWEIFVTAMAIIFAVLLCHCIICCTPCCNDGGDARGATPHGVRTATAAELTDKEKKRLLEEPILDPKKAPRTTTTPAQTTRMGSPTSAATDNTSNNNPDGLMSLKSNETTTLPSNTDKRRRRNTLWSEVVSVWSEFMQYGFSMRPVDVDPEMYQKYEEEPPPRKTKSKSPRRRSKKGGGGGETSFIIHEVPLASPTPAPAQAPTVAAATDDVKPNDKVQKYPQGMIV